MPTTPVTPGQLATLANLSLTLLDTDILVIQQGGIVVGATVAELSDVISAGVTADVQLAIDVVATDLDTQLTALLTALAGKADANHAHTPASVGLGNVANLAPADLPISTAMQEALDLKLNISDFTAAASAESLNLGTQDW